jgi:hypothetical protein
MLTRNPNADQASADVKPTARQQARAGAAATTVLKRIKKQKAAARKAAARYHGSASSGKRNWIALSRLRRIGEM